MRFFIDFSDFVHFGEFHLFADYFNFLGSLIAKEVDYKRSIGLLPAASTGTLSLNL